MPTCSRCKKNSFVGFGWMNQKLKSGSEKNFCPECKKRIENFTTDAVNQLIQVKKDSTTQERRMLFGKIGEEIEATAARDNIDLEILRNVFALKLTNSGFDLIKFLN